MESSHQTRDLQCFADSSNIPWNPPTIFHPDLIATILQTYLLSLCALLSQQSNLFPIFVVSTYNDSRKDLHKLCQIPRNCQCKWLYASYLAPRTFASSFCVSWEVFVFPGYDRIHWVAKSCTTTAHRWLHRDSQFSLRTLWLGSNQFTKIFCTKYGSANASSARRPCNFGPLADLAISAFR